MKKIIASLLAALMLAMPVAPALAKTFGEFPTFLGVDGTADYYIVVGAAAQPADVVGAIDIASRLAELSYTTVTVAGAGAAIEGIERDDIGLYAALSNLPGSGVMKNFHYSGLKDSTFTWRGNDYDFHEQVDVSNVYMRHDFGTSNINGTEKMEIQSGDVVYQYVFDEALTGTGSISDPNYTYPIYVELLGTQFAIVGTGSNQIKVLQGSIGTATSTTPVTYGDYSIYSDLGASDSWARIIIKDSAGNTVDTLIIDQGSSKDSSATGLTVKVTKVRALTDGTIVGVDLVVGPRGEVEKTYDTSADTTSTGTASDRFPGETDWGIKVSGFSTAGQIAVGDKIEVVYQPTETVYLTAGEKLTLPNNYAELGFEGWNTDDFATITVRPVSSLTAYSQSNPDTLVASGLNGLEISTDVSSSIGGVVGGNWYSKAYALIKHGNTPTNITVYYGFYDESSQKILVNSTVVVLGGSSNTANAEYFTAALNGTTGTGTDVTYPFKLRYAGVGDKTFTLRVKFDSTSSDIVDVMVNDGSNDQVIYDFENKTALSTSSTPEFRLGTTASSAQETEVKANTESTQYNVGKASQDVVADGGIIVVAPATYGAADKAVFKIPAKELKVKVYFGKMGAAATEGGEYKVIKPITSSVALLDTEVTATHKAKNIIAVGGPCVNRITAEALGLTYPACGAASTIPENAAMIKIIDDVFTPGKSVVVVAGWEAENTRTACTVLQNYDTLLTHVADQSAVKVTAATQTGITVL